MGGETARWISERFPRVWQDRTSISINSSDTSINKSHQWESALTPATIATLSSGEFVGIVADDPGREMELKAFHARLKRNPKETPPSLSPLPIVRDINTEAVKANFVQIRQDIATLVDEEIRKILNDPGNAGLVVSVE